MLNAGTRSKAEIHFSAVIARYRNIFPTDATLRRFWRFMTIGMLNTLIDFALFAALSGPLGLPTLAANTLSYSAGIVNGYLFNRLWTFSNAPRKTTGVQFAQFVAVSLTALIINNALVLLLAPPLGAVIAPTYGSFLAKICATGVGLCWNFSINNFWTFRDRTMKGTQP